MIPTFVQAKPSTLRVCVNWFNKICTVNDISIAIQENLYGMSALVNATRVLVILSLSGVFLLLYLQNRIHLPNVAES